MDTAFLIWTLFFPRLTLLYCYFVGNAIPLNTLPFWLDGVMAVFIPRVLVCIYIAQNIGMDNAWFVTHVVVAILSYLGAINNTSSTD